MNAGEIAAGIPPTPGDRHADRVGGRLYVAGQVPHDRTGMIVGVGDAAEHCRQCLRNHLALVRHHGFAFGDVHRLTVYVIGDRAVLGTAWYAVVQLSDGSAPLATLLGAAVLGHEHQLVEIGAEIDREPLPLRLRLRLPLLRIDP